MVHLGQMIAQQPGQRRARPVMVETGADAGQFTGEVFPGGVARLVGDGVEDDEADGARPPGQVIDAGLGGARVCGGGAWL